MIVNRLARCSLVEVDLSGTEVGHGWQQLARPDGHVRKLERGCSGAVLHVNPAPSEKRVFGTRCSWPRSGRNKQRKGNALGTVSIMVQP